MRTPLPILVTALAAFVLVPGLPANPKGPQVTAGNITINGGPGAMTITQLDQRGIIHWQDFSIGAGELTQFIHANSKAATLNRVVGGIPSSIHGTLQANGQVYLINPNGILVGPTGRINTAAFIASALDVPDAQFMAGGDMRFSGPSLAGLVNSGTITASDGDVVRMARNVVNPGTISAPNGVAALAAGNDILLQAAGDERVVIVSGTPGGGTGVENSGRIEAAQAELKAAGGNVYALAVNNSGIVKATGLAQRNGRVILSANGGVVQNKGQLIAKNADGSGGSVRMSSGKGGSTINTGSIDASADNPAKNGGTVELTGDIVTVGANSLINASGLNAGTVAVGLTADAAAQTTGTGGVATLAADPNAKSAQQTLIEASSRILANATRNSIGNGGHVVVWSDQKSTVGGVIEARGGALGGNGGLIETSGKTILTVTSSASINASAPKGKAGTWLLDPTYDLSVVAGSGTSSNAGATTFEPTGNNSSVGADLISAQLNAGTNVTIATTSSVGAGVQTGNIIVNAYITKTSGAAATLQMTADGSITLLGNIDGGAAGNLDVHLSATQDILSSPFNSITAKNLTMTSTNGSIDLSGPVVVDTLEATLTNFFSGGIVNIAHPTGNKIGTINGITSSHGVEVRDSEGGLIINGNVSGGGFALHDNFPVILRTVGNFTINAGASIFTNSDGDIMIEAKDGYFINHSGSPFNQGFGSSSGWAVYSASNATTGGGLFDDGGLIAAQSPAIAYNGSDFPSGVTLLAPPSITGNEFVFKEQNGIPFGGSSGSGGGGSSGGGSSTPPGSSRAAAGNAIAGPIITSGFRKSSKIEGGILISQVDYEAQRLAEAQRFFEQSLKEVANTPPPVEPLAPLAPKLRSLNYIGDVANLEPKEVDAITVEEVKKANALLIAKGLNFNSADAKDIGDIISDINLQRQEFANYTKRAGEIEAGKLSKEEYDNHLQAGLRNLDSLRQDLAATEDRLLAKIAEPPALVPGTNTVVYADKETGKIIFVQPLNPDPSGKASLQGLVKIGSSSEFLASNTTNFLASNTTNAVSSSGTQLIGYGGSTLIGYGGSTLIGHDGSTVVANDGAGAKPQGNALIGYGGSTLIGHDGSTVVANDGAGAKPQGNALIGYGGSTLIGHDGSTVVANDGAGAKPQGNTLIGYGGSTLIGLGGSTLIGHDGSTVVANDGAGLVGQDASSLIGKNVSGIIGKGGAGAVGR